MNKQSRLGALAAFVGALCNVVGLISLLYIAPDVNQFPEGRLRVMDTYGNLLYLWYFIVYACFGICVFFVNHALQQSNEKLTGILALITTLSAYLSASYMFIICSIEILSNMFFLAEHQHVLSTRSELASQIYAVLLNLRNYTEWTLDLWFILISVLLFRRKKISQYLFVFGVCLGAFGILILHPSIQPFALYYVAGVVAWFTFIGLYLWNSKVPEKILIEDEANI
jgi:hypothetical protein